MRFPQTSLLSLWLLAPLHQAQAQDFPGVDNAFMPPGDGDVRSPCPFINALANHGLINRNGKNVDLFEMATILSDSFDAAVPLFNFLSNNSVENNLTTTDANNTIRMDIDALFQHNVQEHDASFVRADDFFGQEASQQVDGGLVDALLALNPGQDFLTKDDLHAFQRTRVLDTLKNNPEASIAPFTIFMGAQAALLLVLGQTDDLSRVSKTFLEQMLREERIPDSFVPRILTNPSFVLHDLLDDTTLSNMVFNSFKDAIETTLDEEMMDDETPEPPENEMPNDGASAAASILSLSVPAIAILVLMAGW